MCNLGEGIMERGIEQGMAQGMERGIKMFVIDRIEDGADKKTVVCKLMQRFSLSEDEAEAYYSACAKNNQGDS